MASEDVSEVPSIRGAVRVASVAALGGLLFGYDSAVINGAVAAIQSEFRIDDATLGFAVASALLGAAAGALTAGRLADRVGRLAVMKIAALLFLVSGIGTGLAPGVWVVVVFRIFGGIGVGVASVIGPAYIAETSPAEVRGRLSSLQQLAIVSGIFLSLGVDWLLAHLAGGSRGELWLGLHAWRWMFVAMTVPALSYGMLTYTLPESPRYLVAKQRIPQASQVLAMLMGRREAESVISRIQESLRAETPSPWRALRKPAGGLHGIVWTGLGLAVFQQLVGINVIFYYSNALWEAVGFDERSSFTITVITSVTNIVTTLIAIALIDRIGRRPLLLIGSIGMSVTLATMAAIFGNAAIVAGKPHLEGAAGTVALMASNLFVVAFGMSWGPVLWVLLGEMFPNQIRAAAVGLGAAGNWAANWLITVTFPGLRETLGRAYGFYALCAALSLLFVWRWVRETKGKQLEDMQP